MAVIELVRRRTLTEEYSFIWIVCATALLALSLWRNILELAAAALGVHYPPAVLLLVLTLFVVVVSLYFSVVVSRQRKQIERLVEEMALLDAHVRELRLRFYGFYGFYGFYEVLQVLRLVLGCKFYVRFKTVWVSQSRISPGSDARRRGLRRRGRRAAVPRGK